MGIPESWTELPGVRPVRCAPRWPDRGPTYWEVREVRSLQAPYQPSEYLKESRSRALRLITQLGANRFESRRQAMDALVAAREKVS